MNANEITNENKGEREREKNVMIVIKKRKKRLWIYGMKSKMLLICWLEYLDLYAKFSENNNKRTCEWTKRQIKRCVDYIYIYICVDTFDSGRNVKSDAECGWEWKRKSKSIQKKRKTHKFERIDWQHVLACDLCVSYSEYISNLHWSSIIILWSNIIISIGNGA